MATDSRADLVERAARAGAREANSYFRRALDRSNKVDPDAEVINPGDVVTEADLAAQRRVVDLIEGAYPDDAVVGEEEDELKTVPETGYAWVIDPIDGTYNFARGGEYWATSVAVLEDGEPFAAANVAPALEDVYAAGPGGATRNGLAISVTDHDQPRHGNVGATFIPDRGSEGRGPYAAGVADLLERFGNVRRYGTAQLTLSHVAAGVLDGALGPGRANPWDSIAGAYLIERAGGRVTDFHGDPWRHGAEGLVASNGRDGIHDALLSAARTMAGD